MKIKFVIKKIVKRCGKVFNGMFRNKNLVDVLNNLVQVEGDYEKNSLY